MSSEYAIQMEDVSKSFRMYGRPYQRLLHTVLRSRADQWFGQFHALKNINLRIAPGETVGVVGRNGSGKSTLLQIICGVLRPTEGRVLVDGRIAALLELGAGFNPDFTGRENVYLNGAVLGLTRQQLDERFDAIVAFADIGRFIDQPVKIYSSGMYIRLAFAVAINTDPRILVVDEALSVGDEAFQRKCFARIEELKRQGCTILFVSHSADSVVQLCDRAVLLDGGEVLFIGPPKEAVALYQRILYASEAKGSQIREEARKLASNPPRVGGGVKPSSSDEATITTYGVDDAERYDPAFKSESTVEYESRGARIIDPHIVNRAGDRVNVLAPGGDYFYRYRVEFNSGARHVHFGMMVKSVAGVELFGMATHAEGDAIAQVERDTVYEIEFRFRSHLLPGTYFMNAGVVGCASGVEGSYMHRVLDALAFKIERVASDRRKVGFYDLAEEPASRFKAVPGPVSSSVPAGLRGE